jgi:hypothetical protein
MEVKARMDLCLTFISGCLMIQDAGATAVAKLIYLSLALTIST